MIYHVYIHNPTCLPCMTSIDLLIIIFFAAEEKERGHNLTRKLDMESKRRLELLESVVQDGM